MPIRALTLLLAMLAANTCHAGLCDEMPATLATMRSVDQAVRMRLMTLGNTDQREGERVSIVDRQNTRQLEALLRACGWPVVHHGNWQASDDAWLLAQHADQNRPFQHFALKLLAQAVESGHARGGHLAYLSDRLALAEGRPQLYGTQFKIDGCKLEFANLDTREAVDKRRAAIPGMPTLEAYERMAREHVMPPGCAKLD